MPKKKRTLHDKYYRMAKEQGYRSRASYKLVQLNKKYNFLSNATTCLDLCAAPGGWLQVAAKIMPQGSTVVGVDLLPIRPIRNCTTFVCDITTEKCRQILRKEFKTKVDIVLHDGAPNIGTSWVMDAYGQNYLTLHSLKLAVDMLTPRGWFITKVFRSKDYNSLLYVFNKLFAKVSVTKPPASRNTSAEIFVVCEGFLAPKQIDPRLLDHRHVFKEIEADAKESLKQKEMMLFNRGSKLQKRHRDGYDTTSALLYRKCSVKDFIERTDPIIVLADNNTLVFEDAPDVATLDTNDEDVSAKYGRDPLTTEDIKIHCQDIRVLGRREIKELLVWRIKLREKYIEKPKKKEEEEAEEDELPLTAEEISSMEDEQLKQIIEAQKLRKKKQLKKQRKKKAKLQRRIDMGMHFPDDLWDFSLQGKGLFELNAIKGDKTLRQLKNVKPDDVMSDEDDEQGQNSEDEALDEIEDEEDYAVLLDKHLESQYQQYLKQTKNATKREKIGKKTKEKKITMDDLFEDVQKDLREKENKNKEPDLPQVTGWDELHDDDDSEQQIIDKTTFDVVPIDSDNNSSPYHKSDDNNKRSKQKQEPRKRKGPLSSTGNNSLVVKTPSEMPSTSTAASRWFSQDLFQGLADDESLLNAINTKPELDFTDDEDENDDMQDEAPANKTEDNSKNEYNSEEEEEEGEDDFWNSKSSKNENDFEVVPKGVEYDEDEWEDLDDDEKAEILAMGTLVKTGKRKWSDLIENSYNRYTYNDPELPSWFVDDERKHSNPQKPVTKEMINEVKFRFQELNARPIKKVAEAKARKKQKMHRQLDKMRQEANNIATNEDMDGREKARALERLYKKQLSKINKREKTVFVVQRKFQKGRTAAKKGKARVKVVDRRLKSDLRGISNAERKAKRRKFHK